MRLPRLLGVLALAGAALAACSSAAPNASVASAVARDPSAAYAPTSAQHPACGWKSRTSYRHVVWIWMENRSYQQVLGNGGATRLKSYADRCGVATNYRAISHPSLPNYIAATSGSTHGISSDCDPSSCPVSGTSLYAQAGAKGGGGWAGYAENMTRPCDTASYNSYAARHNPAVYYTALRSQCRRRDLAMGGTSGRFATALTSNRLPAFSFVTPNLCDDGHDCSTATADKWLGYWLGRIVRSPTYRAGHTAVFVTWDEGETSTNQVATVVVAPTVRPGTRAGQRFTHYSLLRTTEQLLGFPPIGAAARAASMQTAFRLR